MTSWVTVKLPEEIRDDAREDRRTYGEIMRDGLDQPSIDVGGVEKKLDQIQNAQATTVNDALELAELPTEEILGRLDDLESQLPGKVAREVHKG